MSVKATGLHFLVVPQTQITYVNPLPLLVTIHYTHTNSVTPTSSCEDFSNKVKNETDISVLLPDRLYFL